MTKPANKTKWPDEKKRRSAAFAICNSAIMSDGHRGYVIDLADSIGLAEGDKTWVHLVRYGEFDHPVFGMLDMSKEKIGNFVKNFRKNVRGVMLDIDYTHKSDQAKGNKAAGWIISLDQRADGLWGQVSWTGEALKEVKDGAWKYMSIEFADEWCDAQGSCYDDVLFGAALTNRPFMKGLSPINFAELDNGAFEQPEGKYSQEDSHYRSASDSMYRCANCAFFQPNSSSCMVVDGEIGADMTSDYFKPMNRELFSHALMEEDNPEFVDPVELGIKEFRDIPMKTRKSMPSGDFAGSGTSFPIQKCADVRAAFHALGLTKQNSAQVRSRIISIAKRKGFTSCLPATVKADEFMDELTARRILSIVRR
jgi:hypothetical protein